MLQQNTLAFLVLSIAIFYTTAATAQCIEGDCVNGIGKYKFKSGTEYEGSFQKGQFHGYGICRYADGDTYEGWWEERQPEGKGKLRKSDGTIVSGLWSKGVLVDKSGVILDADFVEKTIQGGEIQIGCLFGDCKDGYGIIGFPSGDKYEGEFVGGKFHGKGKWIYPYGDVFEGTYIENVAHGNGKIIHKDETITEGIWEHGDYIGETKNATLVDCTYQDCGNLKYGMFKYSDGSIYIGEFMQGKPEGWGRIEYQTGEIYEGDWKSDIANGYGTFITIDGSNYTGIWEAGQYISDGNATSQVVEEYDETQAATHKETKVWAVIVGVSSYKHMKPLRYSDNDAFRLMALMQSPAGGALPDEQIRVLIDEDATKDGIITSMKELYSQAGPNDLILMYFSGHGLMGSFLPIDYDGYDNKLYHDEIREVFNSSKAKYKLCIADACHSGSYSFAAKGEVEDILTEYYEELSKSEGGTALILSSKPEETSLESQRIRQGVFSHYLLRGMKGEADTNNNGIVTLNELYNYIAEEVKIHTQFRQTPILKGDFDSDMPISVVRKK